MRAVDVGIGHDDDLVVAQLRDVELGADAGAEALDDGLELVVADDLVDAGLLDVEHLAPEGKDGLDSCGRGPSWPSRLRNRPLRCRSRTWSGSFSWQSASLPGRPALSRKDLRRVSSRACRAAMRALAARTVFSRMASMISGLLLEEEGRTARSRSRRRCP